LITGLQEHFVSGKLKTKYCLH